MDDSFNELIYFPVWLLPETAIEVLCNRLVGALPNTLLVRDTIIPLVRGKGSPPRTNDLTRLPAVTDRQQRKETYTHMVYLWY